MSRSVFNGTCLFLCAVLTVGTARADEGSSLSSARLSLAREPRSGELESRESSADSNVYVGVGFGRATNRYNEFSRPRSDTAYKVFFGYSYNKYVATEFSYLNISSDDGQYVASTVQLSQSSYVGSAVGRLPLGDYFSLLGKIGYAAYDTRAYTPGGTEKSRTRGDFSYGIITALDLGKHFAIRAEYEAVGVSSGVYDLITMSGLVKF